MEGRISVENETHTQDKYCVSAVKIIAPMFWDCKGVLLIDSILDHRTHNAITVHKTKFEYQRKRADFKSRIISFSMKISGS